VLDFCGTTSTADRVVALQRPRVASHDVVGQGRWAYALSRRRFDGFAPAACPRKTGAETSRALRCWWRSRSRTRFVRRRACPSRTAAITAALFGALENLKGARARIDLVRQPQRRAIFVRHAHTPERARHRRWKRYGPTCRSGLRGGFALAAIAIRQAAPDGARSRTEKADQRDRDRRQSAQRGQGRDPRRDSCIGQGCDRIGDRRAAIGARLTN